MWPGSNGGADQEKHDQLVHSGGFLEGMGQEPSLKRSRGRGTSVRKSTELG